MNQDAKRQTALVATEPRGNPPPVYWARVSAWYEIASKIILVALLLFLVLFVAIGSRTFTYDSMFCFVRDLQSAASFVPADYGTVSYTYEEGEHTVLSFRGGVAAVNGGGVEIYSPNGERLLDAEFDFANPRAVSSRKYLLAYDFGSKDFAVTNAYAVLYRGESEFPVLFGTVSDSGQTALVTTAADNLSRVLLYDTNFHLVQLFSRAGATVGVSVSANGKWISILTMESSLGKPQTTLELYRIGEKEAAFSLSLEGEMPLGVSFTDSKHIAVLTDNALRVCDLQGKWESETALEGAAPLAFAAGEDGFVLSLESDALFAKSRIFRFSKKGELLYDVTVDGKVSDVDLTKDYTFLFSGESVVRLDAEGNGAGVLTFPEGASSFFALDDERVRVVYAGEAQYLKFPS